MDPSSGRILLFYTQGDTSTRAYWRHLDFTNMNQPHIGPAHLIQTTGLTGTTGAPDYLNNYDVALDRTSGTVVVVREQHPYPTDNPSWIGASLAIDTISLRHLLDGRGTWHQVNTISPALTGLPRNHNAGLVRSPDGSLPDPNSLTVTFTSSCSGPTCDSLYNYDLWQITGHLQAHQR